MRVDAGIGAELGTAAKIRTVELGCPAHPASSAAFLQAGLYAVPNARPSTVTVSPSRPSTRLSERDYALPRG